MIVEEDCIFDELLLRPLLWFVRDGYPFAEGIGYFKGTWVDDLHVSKLLWYLKERTCNQLYGFQ